MGTKKISITEKASRNINIILFLAPTLVLFSVFILYPNVLSFYYAMLDWDGISSAKTFTGLRNFVKVLQDKLFLEALLHNIVFLVTIPVLTFVLAMFFANALTQGKYRESGFYKTVFYFPNILSVSLIGLLWIFIYSPRNGMLNNILSFIGLKHFETFPWLGNPDTALGALVFPQVWSGVGFYMVLMIAAINGIPLSLYEAADIDGAGKLSQLLKITIPLVWEMVKISFIFMIINAFSSFQLILVTTGGGPIGSTQVLGSYMISYIMQNAFSPTGLSNPQYGYASAVGVMIFFIVIVLTLILNRFMKKDTVQY